MTPEGLCCPYQFLCSFRKNTIKKYRKAEIKKANCVQP